MKRPKVTLHIFSSLDGRITGDFGKSPAAKGASKLFKQLGFSDELEESFHFDGWIYGKRTSIDGFGNHEPPDLRANASILEGDHLIGQGENCYYIALDPRGEIGWQKNYAEYGGKKARVLAILTKDASEAYRDFLWRKEIPYLIAGQKEIDLALMLEKLATHYGLRNLMLGGGGNVNWTFLKNELIDEVSLVLAPVVDGQTDTARLFDATYAKDPHACAFSKKSVKSYADGTLWLRYLPKKTGGNKNG